MNKKCPFCKKEKDTVGLRIVGSRETRDPRFIQEQLSLETVIMCNDCLEDYKQGKITTKPKKKIS